MNQFPWLSPSTNPLDLALGHPRPSSSGAWSAWRTRSSGPLAWQGWGLIPVGAEVCVGHRVGKHGSVSCRQVCVVSCDLQLGISPTTLDTCWKAHWTMGVPLTCLVAVWSSSWGLTYSACPAWPNFRGHTHTGRCVQYLYNCGGV